MEAASDGAAIFESTAAAASAAAVTTSAAAATVRSAAAAAEFAAAAAAGGDNGDDEDGDDGEVGAPATSASSVAPMLMLRRKRWVIAMVVIVWFSFMLARLTSVLLDVPFLYSPTYAYSSSGSSWWAVRVSVLVGLEAGLVTVLALLVLQVPTMIIVWTTALLFDYAANRGGRSRARQSRLVRKASWMARDIFMTTTRSVLREGNLVAVVVSVSCLLLLLVAGYLVVT